ncbi:MAG: arylsulfatase [Planctomycetota bacterium]
MRYQTLLIAKSLLFIFLIAQPGEVAAQDENQTKLSTPNVILIMTDDQGIGDFGCMGNPKVQTPNVDAMFERSARFTHFYVSPVCSPTRASLMTGRYNYRTRVVDTYIGRSMMEPEEVTLAERFKRADYATGIFGKWHLGDCYPMRPHDQGFDRAVVHRGGGIGQSSDPMGAAGAYTDPILQHNGVDVQESGYCTDVYYDHAIDFIERSHRESKPFFVYLPDNCPHGPFDDVPKKWWDVYRDQDLSNDQLPTVADGYPVRKGSKRDITNRVFAMISNIDENIGRLQKKLDQLGITDNTIVIFMTDNGPNGERYTCGLRGRKTSVYEGGIRTLFLMQWPNKIKSKSTHPEIAAHIDLVPTLVDACQLPAVADEPKLDGISLYPIVSGDSPVWKDQRSHLFFQVHRGNTPVKYHHFAVRDHQFKLVHHSGFGAESFEGEPTFELFDLKNDPYEKTDIASQHPDQVASLRQAYDDWFADVSTTRPDNYVPPRIVVSPAQENPLLLSRQDARRPKGVPRDVAALADFWRLTSPKVHDASVRLYFRRPVSGTIQLHVGDTRLAIPIDNAEVANSKCQIPKGDFEIKAYLNPDKANQGNKQDSAMAVFQVELVFEK